VNTHGSNKESSEETSKEDRKEEIVSLPKHTHRFWAGGEILQPSFCGLPRDMKLYFGGKKQAKIISC
jgi:hypothetical protein